MCIFLPFYDYQQLGQSAQTIKRSKVRYDQSMNWFAFFFDPLLVLFACTLCALREKEREKEFGRALWEQKPLLESIQNNKCASGGMLRLALLQHVSRCWSAASGDFPTYSGEFCSALDAVSSLYFKQLHCFLRKVECVH